MILFVWDKCQNDVYLYSKKTNISRIQFDSDVALFT